MALQSDDQRAIRQYLLGELSTEDQFQQVEERLITDGEFFQELEISEYELIDEYLNDALTPDERSHFESYFLSATERQSKLSFSRALKTYVARANVEDEDETEEERSSQTSKNYQPPLWTRLLSSPYLRTAAAFLVLIALGLGIWRVFFYQSETQRGLIALERAYRQERPIEARTSVLAYAPLLETRGGTQAKVDETSRNLAERLLLDAVRNEPGPASRHALGLLYLSEKKFDDAIQEFTEALKADPQNARIHSDMGAALFERGIARANVVDGRSLEEFAESRDHLSRALELDSSLLEALFNRALCYEHSGLPRQAEDDWRKYLERDPNSPWAAEAKQHLRRLEQERSSASQNEEQMLQDFLVATQTRDDDRAWQIVSRSNSSAGNLITNKILDSYLDLEAQGQHDAAQAKLQALVYAGQLIVERTGDRYTSDLAKFYNSASTARLSSLAQARSQMKKAYELFTQSRLDEAIASYTAAKQIFDQAGDTSEAIFARYRIGHCYVLEPDTERSQPIFDELTSTCTRNEYKWLLAQSLYESAHIQVGLSEYTKAVDYSAGALKLSEQIDDTDGILKSLVQMADEYRSLNNPTRSLGFLQKGLFSIINGYPEPTQNCWGLYFAIALYFDSLGLHTTALDYQREALQLALAMNRPLIVSRSYAYLGTIYGKLNNYDEAIRNIESAFDTAKSLSGQPNGLDMMGNTSLQLGEIYRQTGDYNKALDAYNQSINYYDGLNFKYFFYAAHKGKLLCYKALGDDAATEEELQAVLPLFDQYRSKITGESQRNSYFDAEQSIYDLAIDFADSRKQNSQLAFEYSEESRARSLLDIMRQGTHVVGQEFDPELGLSSGAKPLTLSQLQERMPDHVQIIQYALLDNRLLIWVISKGKFQSAQPVEISAEVLNGKVQKYLSLIKSRSESGSEEARQVSGELHDILLKPVESFLDSNDEMLCIVPDKILNYLPFSALLSTTSGRYLVQDFSLQLSPSSSVFIECSNIANSKAGVRDERLLSVGSPSFNHASFPTLSDLPEASREARAITTFYRSSRLLLGAAARVREIRSEIETSDVLHFALHYVVDERSAMLSQLVLAEEPGEHARHKAADGSLRAYEIYEMKPTQARLVVLSACQTGIERQYSGEGAVGLARPFIAARVPLVVASLWPVDSSSTADLMIAFHKYRKQDGMRIAKALQRAQAEMLQGQDERYRQPYYWASFVAIGGHTDY